MLHTIRAVAGLTVLACGVAACSGGEDGGPSDTASSASRPVAMPGLTVERAQRILADYDRRNNGAITAAWRAPYDESKWASADLGPVLESDVFATRIRRYGPRPKQSPPPHVTYRATGVIGTVRHRKGELALVQARPERASAATSTSAREAPQTEEIRVMYRERPKGVWRLWQSLTVRPGGLPRALAVRSDPTPTPAQVKASQRLPQQFIDSIRQEPGAPFAQADSLVGKLDEMWPNSTPHPDLSRTIQCRPYAPPGSTDARNSLMLARSRSTVVNVVTARCRVDIAVENNRVITYPKALSRIYGFGGEGVKQSTLTYVMSGLIVQPASGRPTLQAAEADVVVPD